MSGIERGIGRGRRRRSRKGENITDRRNKTPESYFRSQDAVVRTT
jgi:hypothetical protein